MKKIFNFIACAAIAASAVAVTSCNQKDPAEEAKYASESFTLKGVVAVNNDLTRAEQIYTSVEGVEIIVEVDNSSRSSYGMGKTIIKTTTNANGEYSVKVPSGVDSGACAVRFAEFKGTLIEDDGSGGKKTTNIMWKSQTAYYGGLPGQTVLGDRRYNGNFSSTYEVLDGKNVGDDI